MIKITGPIQYYCDKQEEIISDLSYVNKQALVVETQDIGKLAKVKLIGGIVAHVHPKNIELDINSQDQQWLSKGAIVKISGQVSTQDPRTRSWGGRWGQPQLSPDDGSWMNPPGKQCTDKFIGKLAQVIYIGKGKGWWTTDSDFIELKITGKRGAKYYAVCWPSAIEPVFTI